MTGYRIDRVNKELLRELSEIIRRYLKNKTAREAIFTAVDCSRDLRHAKVFFITLDPRRQKVVLAALRNASGPIRGLLGKAMSLRVVPELVFILDKSEEKAREMDRLLDSIRVNENIEPERDIEADGNSR